jgi:hypothetical protein
MYMYYIIITDINTEIKKVIFNFSIYKLTMHIDKRHLNQKGIKQADIKHVLWVYVIKFHKLNQQTHCVQCVSSSLFIKCNMYKV